MLNSTKSIITGKIGEYKLKKSIFASIGLSCLLILSFSDRRLPLQFCEGRSQKNKWEMNVGRRKPKACSFAIKLYSFYNQY